MSTLVACSLDEARLGRWEGKRVRRKGGTLVYVVVGAKADRSYEASYSFTNWFVVLERVTRGSSSRPPGSHLTVPEPEFRYDWAALSDSGEDG